MALLLQASEISPQVSVFVASQKLFEVFTFKVKILTTIGAEPSSDWRESLIGTNIRNLIYVSVGA